MQSVVLEQIETMNGLGGLIWFNEFKPDQFLCMMWFQSSIPRIGSSVATLTPENP